MQHSEKDMPRIEGKPFILGTSTGAESADRSVDLLSRGLFQPRGREHGVPMPSTGVQVPLRNVPTFRRTCRILDGELEPRWRCGLNPRSQKNAGMPGPSRV